jgi:hypothetical protein
MPAATSPGAGSSLLGSRRPAGSRLARSEASDLPDRVTRPDRPIRPPHPRPRPPHHLPPRARPARPGTSGTLRRIPRSSHRLGRAPIPVRNTSTGDRPAPPDSQARRIQPEPEMSNDMHSKAALSRPPFISYMHPKVHCPQTPFFFFSGSLYLTGCTRFAISEMHLLRFFGHLAS